MYTFIRQPGKVLFGPTSLLLYSPVGVNQMCPPRKCVECTGSMNIQVTIHGNTVRLYIEMSFSLVLDLYLLKCECKVVV